MRSSSFAVRTTSASGVRSVPVRAVFTKERIASKTNDRADQQQKPGFSLPFFSRSASPAALNGTSGKKREEGTKVDKAEEYRRRQGFGAIISALDFAETRSKSDAQLLYDAKYGKRSTDGKMSREQVSTGAILHTNSSIFLCSGYQPIQCMRCIELANTQFFFY